MNKSEAYLMDNRLLIVFPRSKDNGSYNRTTRVLSGQNVSISIVLATFEGHQPPPFYKIVSSLPLLHPLLPFLPQ